jgi:hypothetical protein
LVPQVPLPGPSQALVQPPLSHVGFCPVQGWQVLPFFPQASLPVPSTQVEPLQQPPLHVSPPAHDVLQACALLQAFPAGQSFALLQPQTPFDWHLPPSGDDVQSGSWTHPQVVPVQALPLGDEAQLTQLPAVPQLAGVPRQAPESCGGGGGASETTSLAETASEVWASVSVTPVSWVEESVPEVASTAAPLSPGTTTSWPIMPSSPTLPSLASSRPAPLSPHAATARPSAHGSARAEAILDGCTSIE